MQLWALGLEWLMWWGWCGDSKRIDSSKHLKFKLKALAAIHAISTKVTISLGLLGLNQGLKKYLTAYLRITKRE
jgi:hypothetical protein